MDKDKSSDKSGRSRDSDTGDHKRVQFHPIHIGPISTLEEMDMKVLQFQNKKLAARIEERKRSEAELRQRIEQLEKRQTQDDAVLNVVNRYWNQLNEDIRILLLRFNAETTDESENLNECETTTSFLMQLSTWDKKELDEKLASRVQVSLRAVGKIIQAFDRMLQRYNKIAVSLEENSNVEEIIKENYIEIQSENKKLHQLNTSAHQKSHAMSLKTQELEDRLNARETETAELKNRLDDIEYERAKLQTRNNKLDHHLAEAMEKLKDYEQMYSDSRKESSSSSSSNSAVSSVVPTVNHKKLEELQEKLEEQKEVANNRLQELETTSVRLREALKEIEQLKTDLRNLPEATIVETTEYKTLQSQFSVLYNESMQMRTQLEETHNQLQNLRSVHLKQIEMLESEELVTQKKLRTDILQAEDRIAQLCKEYEMLKVEYEQTVVANEQSGPLNREMRHLINSLQSHNSQLKNEAHRYKRKYKEANMECVKLKKEIEDLKYKLYYQSTQSSRIRERSASITNEEELHAGGGTVEVDEEKHHHEPCSSGGIGIGGTLAGADILDKSSGSSSSSIQDTERQKHLDKSSMKKDTNASKSVSGGLKSDSSQAQQQQHQQQQMQQQQQQGSGSNNSNNSIGSSGGSARHKDAAVYENEIKELKNTIRKMGIDLKEVRLVLDMYKGVGKDHRDKAALMAGEKKLKAEIEDLKQQLRKAQECKRDDRKKISDDDAQRRIKYLEEQVQHLQKINQLHKQEEEASLCEMEVTGQAFEDMQEQNSRLIQQLHEKDDANFKLMTERIKSNQMFKNAAEEKEALQDAVSHLTVQIENLNMVVRKLEEKERVLQSCIVNVEKELTLCRQALEMYKRKAIESAQSAADLKMHLEKYHTHMKEAQQVVTEKTSALESEAYKTNRLQEEIAQFKREIGRMKKLESAETMDVVLLEEIREYKETLTCPSCKVQRKDAVLIKCFHVFCFDCLRTRYETRQRKCPKCNAAFGANDYHRLYLGN